MTIYAFTSVAANYLPKARVLADSIKRRNPGVRFCVVLAEREVGGLQGRHPEIDEIIGLGDLAIDDLESWVFEHTLVELCTAVKGVALDRLLARPDCTAVIYFDPDIVVLADLDFLDEPLAQGSIVLTPHLTEPDTSLEAIRDNEISALRHGVYNLGFLAVANRPEGCRFAAWWWERLRHFCYDDISGGLFTDQRWVDLAPAFFEDLVIVRDPGWNVATWNLTHREVAGTVDSGFTVNGRPLRFYHFSGLDSGAQLAMLDKYGRSMPALYELRDWYLERCEALGGVAGGRPPWSYERFDNGAPIERRHRVLYRRRVDLQRAFPDPYDTTRTDSSYYHWYVANVERGAEDVGGETDDGAASRRELESIYASRAWRLATGLQRLAAPVRQSLRSVRRVVGGR